MFTRSLVFAFVLLGSLFVAPPSLAQSEIIVDSNKVTLADIVPNADPERGLLTVADTPAPGASRLLARADIERVLRRAGLPSQGLAIPSSMRIKAAEKRMTEDEIAQWVAPAIELELPPGVQLVKLSTARPLVTSPSASLGRVTLPRIPKRAGEFRSTVVVELEREQVILQRLTLSFVAQISAEAAQPDVARGAQVSLVIETAGVTLTAAAIALSSGNVGEVHMFRVITTRKVLRARIETAQTAKVVVQ